MGGVQLSHVNDDLFRSDALEARNHDWLGTVRIAVPVKRWVYSGLTALFAVSVVMYLFLGHYTRKAAVKGELAPTAGLITLSATTQSIVANVLVREGQRVQQGEPLVEFDNPLVTSSLGDARNVISDQIESQRTGLEKDLQTQRRIADSRVLALRERIRSLEKQSEELAGQLALQEEQTKSFEARLAKMSPLANRGYLSDYELEQQKSRVASSRAQTKSLTREALDVRQQIDQAQQDLAQAPLSLAREETSTNNRLAELQQSLAQNEGQRAWILRAPRAGLVSALLVKPGQAVASGRVVVSVLPENSLLEAEILVPSDSIGFVRNGQRVVLRYQAFPYQKFGQYFGYVREVSHNALNPSEAESIYGQHSDSSLYRVVVSLDKQSVDAYGAKLALMPGMSVDADVLLDRRRLIEWVIGPIIGAGRKTLQGQS